MLRDLAVPVLGVVVVAAIGCLLRGTRGWGLLLLAASVLWVPSNNGALEGPVLIVVGSHHGLTLADLVGVAGAAVGAFRVWPTGWRSRRVAAARVAVVAGLVLAGFLAALLVTDEDAVAPRAPRQRNLDVPIGQAGRAPLGGAQRSSLDIRRSASTLPPVWQVGQYWNERS